MASLKEAVRLPALRWFLLAYFFYMDGVNTVIAFAPVYATGTLQFTSAELLGLMALVLVRVWRIASLSRDLLGTYICAGVFTMLLWQTFQNVGMTLQIMPVTGLPLPFISYGGSGLIVYFAMLGLVQSVHMRRMR